MLRIEKVIREYNGEQKEIKFLAGVGNLTGDVEKRVVTTAKGETSVAGGKGQSIALNYWQEGEKKSVFFPIEAWGFTADALSKVGKKGKEICVVGRLVEKSFTTDAGKTYINETLVVEQFQITSRGFGDNNAPKNGEGASDSVGVEGFAPANEEDEEEIPF